MGLKQWWNDRKVVPGQKRVANRNNPYAKWGVEVIDVQNEYVNFIMVRNNNGKMYSSGETSLPLCDFRAIYKHIVDSERW